MLVLASTSPRRRAMLTQLGVTFRVETADVMVAEQMYRCYSLLENLPYHR